MTHKYLLCLALLFTFCQTKAQTDTTKHLTISGYVEPYFTYDFNWPATGDRPAFLYNHARNNEFNLNLAYLKVAQENEGLRANFALMAGNYADKNLAAEPGLLKMVMEANAGVRLWKKTWLDVGIFPSHIGFESAISKDCWTLTRSLSAENSPYYESGAKLTWLPNDKWTLVALALNGWQRIHRPKDNSTPAFGTQITWKPDEKITLNWSTFVGNDKPDYARQNRIFHNLYAIFQYTPRLGVTVGFDAGFEQIKKGANTYNQWLSPVVVLRNKVNERFAWAARFEHYEDPQGVIIPTGTRNGFRTNGLSLNTDFTVRHKALLRLEGRWLKSKDAIFLKEKDLVRSNFAVIGSLAVSF